MRERSLATLIALAPLVVLGLALAPRLVPGTPVALAAHHTLSGICHQIPERSFEGMALCHRCTGIDLGLALGALAFAMGLRVRPASRLGWAVCALPMAIQVPLAWLVPAVDLWWLRFATGIVFGGFGGLALAAALGSLLPSSRARVLVR